MKTPGQMSQWKEPQAERLVTGPRARLSSSSPGLPTLSEAQCLTGGSCSFLACRTGTLSTEEVLCLGPFVPSAPHTCSAHVHVGTELTAPRGAFGCWAKESDLESNLEFSPLLPIPPSFYSISVAPCALLPSPKHLGFADTPSLRHAGTKC